MMRKREVSGKSAPDRGKQVQGCSFQMQELGGSPETESKPGRVAGAPDGRWEVRDAVRVGRWPTLGHGAVPTSSPDFLSTFDASDTQVSCAPGLYQ